MEATVLGNLLVQARSCGELSSLSDLREVSRTVAALEFYEPEQSDAWTAAAARFRTLLAPAH